MLRDLTLAQRLVGPDGLPTSTAKATVAVLAMAAAAAGFVAHGDGEPSAGSQRGAVVAVSRLVGELPRAKEPAAPRLTSTARLPGPATQARRRRSAEPARTPAATPAPTPEAVAEPTATPAPIDTPSPATPAPAPASAPAPPPAPRRPAPPVQRFDSSG